MPENYLYYIYIDSKIEGTIDQLLSYFQANIFHASDCICVYFRFYKEVEKYIQKKISAFQIRFKFIRKNSDLIFESNKVVFYLFNAQSNCRVVTRRDLTHVFVTHGESHKIASIKPIIRIYDFVVTSGQVGVDRFLKAGIFNISHVQNEKRVITMGNTFIGQHNYVFDPASDALLYAPTWEGGVPSENYSSICLKTGEILTQLVQKNDIKVVYIQVHPNLGHRDKKYIGYLKEVIQILQKIEIEVVLIKSNIQFKDRWSFSSCRLYYRSRADIYKIKIGVTDISAMEMQLISEDIPTVVLYKSEHIDNLIIPKRVKYLYDVEGSVDLNDFANLDLSVRASEIVKHSDYLISYQEDYLLALTFRQRIRWLCHFVLHKKTQLQQECLDAF